MEHAVLSRVFVWGLSDSALLSFRECQSDERGEQRALARNPGNGCEGQRSDPAWLHPCFQPPPTLAFHVFFLDCCRAILPVSPRFPNLEGAAKDWVSYPPPQPPSLLYPTPAGPHCTAAAFLGHSHPLGSHREGELPFALHHLPLFY